MNECGSATKEQQNDLYDRIYHAIREIDPDHIIHIEAFRDWNMLYPPSQYVWIIVVYHFHYHAMSGKDPSSEEAQDKLVTRILEGLDTHKDWNVPFF